MKTYHIPSVPELFYEAQRIYGSTTDTIELLRQRLASAVQNPGAVMNEDDLDRFMNESRAQFEEVERQWRQEHAKAWVTRAEIISTIKGAP